VATALVNTAPEVQSAGDRIADPAALARWLTEHEFLDTVVLRRLTPGITILAQVLLIGRKVCGVAGMVAGIAGMMLPAVAITTGLALVYDTVSGAALARTPLACVAAVAAGFAVALALALLRDTLAASHRWRGPLAFAGYVGLGALLRNPELVLLTAIAAGLAFPSAFAGRGRDGGEP